jgi:hypothetical protein
MTIVCGGGSTIAHDFVATHALVSPRPASNGAILTGGGGGGGGAAPKFADPRTRLACPADQKGHEKVS